MQVFRIKYNWSNTHVVSQIDGTRSVPRLLNHFRPAFGLNRIFHFEDKLRVKHELPLNITVEELTLKDLHEYLLKRDGHQLTKYAPIIREAWFSFIPSKLKQRRAARKIPEEQTERLVELLDEGVAKAKIARELGVSRTALYKAIDRLEYRILLSKCQNGYFQEACEKAYNDHPKDTPWWIRAAAKKRVKKEILSRLIGFDFDDLLNTNM